MEYLSVLIRNRKFKKAKEVAIESISIHSLAGRLWATLIQLEHLLCEDGNLDEAYLTFLKAVKEVPKSGEVW
jgi:hypothetical protein